ncbi:MAG: FMN-binding protein [Bacillota bacterium]
MKRIFMFTVITLLALTGCIKTQKLPDGTFKGVSDADRHGYAWAEVTLEKGKITSVVLGEYDGLGREKDFAQYPYRPAAEAHALLSEAFAKLPFEDVEAVSGATLSSSKYRQAVHRAMLRAAGASGETREYFDGTFMGIAESNQGRGIAFVTIKNDGVESVTLSEVTPEGQLRDWDNAYEEAARARIQLQDRLRIEGLEADVVAGATASSLLFIEAYRQALELARRK